MGEHTIQFDREVDLATTMDIQIPALEWETYLGGYRTVYDVGEEVIEVTMRRTDPSTVQFTWDDASQTVDEELTRRAEQTFNFFLDEIEVSDEQLETLAGHYGDITYMRTDAFRALLVTILSQNRTGEITRESFIDLIEMLPRVTPEGVVAAGEDAVKDAIRSAGPYKAEYILDASEMLLEEYEEPIQEIVQLPTPEAVEKLTALPGVGHKTAACVLVYSSLKRDTLPIDTHLWRVAQRTGLVEVEGKSLTAKRRREIIDQFTERAPDAGYAHLFLVLLGRNRCSAQNPLHEGCPLEESCPRIDVET